MAAFWSRAVKQALVLEALHEFMGDYYFIYYLNLNFYDST